MQGDDISSDPSACKEILGGLVTPFEVNRARALPRELRINQLSSMLVGSSIVANALMEDYKVLGRREEETARLRAEAEELVKAAREGAEQLEKDKAAFEQHKQTEEWAATAGLKQVRTLTKLLSDERKSWKETLSNERKSWKESRAKQNETLFRVRQELTNVKATNAALGKEKAAAEAVAGKAKEAEAGTAKALEEAKAAGARVAKALEEANADRTHLNQTVAGLQAEVQNPVTIVAEVTARAAEAEARAREVAEARDSLVSSFNQLKDNRDWMRDHGIGHIIKAILDAPENATGVDQIRLHARDVGFKAGYNRCISHINVLSRGGYTGERSGFHGVDTPVVREKSGGNLGALGMFEAKTVPKKHAEKKHAEKLVRGFQKKKPEATAVPSLVSHAAGISRSCYRRYTDYVVVSDTVEGLGVSGGGAAAGGTSVGSKPADERKRKPEKAVDAGEKKRSRIQTKRTTVVSQTKPVVAAEPQQRDFSSLFDAPLSPPHDTAMDAGVNKEFTCPFVKVVSEPPARAEDIVKKTAAQIFDTVDSSDNLISPEDTGDLNLKFADGEKQQSDAEKHKTPTTEKASGSASGGARALPRELRINQLSSMLVGSSIVANAIMEDYKVLGRREEETARLRAEAEELVKAAREANAALGKEKVAAEAVAGKAKEAEARTTKALEEAKEAGARVAKALEEANADRTHLNQTVAGLQVTIVAEVTARAAEAEARAREVAEARDSLFS
ncbi:putative AH/BAR domain superfamily protein [Helianthus annuus]|nr:putative AH/BAR domain superfamily protein [Helianthus annuus]